MTNYPGKSIGPDWFGPMDVEDWLKQWIPRIPKAKKQPFAGLPDHWEDSQVNQFVSVIRKSGLCKSIFPHVTFDRCETDPDPYWDGRGIPCPSIVFSAEDDLLDGDPDSRLSASASCEMFFDINVLSDPDDGDSWYLNADPFDNVRGDWRGNASLGRLDMLANHANVVLNVSHRTHCFAAMIADDVARLVRFDRSGGVYSDLFDWRRTPTLANFIRAFDKMTSEERGWDTSVVRLAKDSPEVSQAWDIARREVDNVLPRHVALSKVIPDPKNETRYLHLVHVYDESTAGTHRLVIGNPLACSDSLASHGTRGYFAVDLDEGTIVFLKDTWRLAMDPYLKESETYEKLIAHGVPHLPGYMIGGDVPVDWRNASDPGRDHEEPVQFQCTNNYDVWADADEKRRAKTGEKPPAETEMVLKPQRHHRIVLRKIGASIEHFKSTKELVGVVRDALEALHHSAKDVKIVHRDLSQGNVMIDKDGRGMLIDWDLAVPYTDDESSVKARQDIQGTWNFMSVNNIMSKGQEVRAHVAADDMEALFHVFCFTALACKMPPFNAFKPGPHGWRPMIARTWSSDGGLLFHRIEFLEEGEANFFRKERLEETIRPEILVRLILELRAIFSAVSGLPPREKDVSSAQIAKERSAAEKILKDGQRLLAIFRKYLNSNKWGGWPEDDVSFKCPEPESSSEDEDEDADADKPPSALERRGEKRKVEAVSDTKDDSPRKRRKSVGKLKMTLRSRPADSSDSSDDS